MADDTFIFIPKGAPYIDTGVSPSVKYDDGQIHAFDSADSDELAAAGRIQTDGAGFDVSSLLAAATGLSLGGQTKFAAGSAAAPSITTTGDLNSGIYFPAADQMAVSLGGAQRLIVTTTGLGIGEASPAEKLHVAGNGIFAGFVRANPSDATDPAFQFSGGNRDGIFQPFGGAIGFSIANAEVARVTDSDFRVPLGSAAAPSFRGFGGGTAAGLFFPAIDKLAISVGGSEVLRANSTGIGVGTTNPLVGLHLDVGFRVGAFDGAAASGSDTGMNVSVGGAVSMSRSGNPPLVLRRVGSDGQIQGFYRDNSAVGSISVTGSLTAYNTTSDARAKTCIKAAGDALAMLLAMPVRQYSMRADGAFHPYGYIAQEVDPFAPHVVTKGATEADLWGVDYSKMVPALHRGFQQLAQRVEALEAA